MVPRHAMATCLLATTPSCEQKHMHYAGFTVAENDVLFLPDYKFGMTGIPSCSRPARLA